MKKRMNQLLLGRLARLSFGLAILLIPLLALLSVVDARPLPERERTADTAVINAPQVITQTQTAIAQGQTAVAQTSIAQTLTSIPGTLTSVAQTQTAVAQPTSVTALVDVYEPNDTLQTAYTILPDVVAVCGANSATLWPVGDVDFYRFQLKAGSMYEIYTSNLTAGLDTFLIVYGIQGAQIAENDDYEFGNRASKVVITAQTDGFYYARISNQSATDPAGKTYCFQVREVPPPSVGAPDSCEPNYSFDHACLLGVGQTVNANFVPTVPNAIDHDFYRMWVKPGFYVCSTFGLSAVSDTNLILYNQNREAVAGSLQNSRASVASVHISYTGWLYALIGSVVPIAYSESGAYTYSFNCIETEPTATPVPFVPGPGSGATAVPAASPTPFIFPTFPPTPTPFTFETATPTPRPSVQINPLPTPTPGSGIEQPINVNVTIYYDSNLNYTPEATEGIADIAVALYAQTTGQLLAFGYTNEAGMVQFTGVTVAGPARVSVPFLKFSQITSNSQNNILIRVAPQPLPIGIP
jgi:hypothetical protein